MACCADSTGGAGWRTLAVDGHDPAALAQAKDSDRPTLIACRTVIGFGAPLKQGTEATHGAPLTGSGSGSRCGA
ncbi:hypothetical protein [Roseiarcus fermentans]|uniref:hypothetical protein n=1 Tax=Roseiarcus fermentans TaxID=1473586 RepID=UPI000DEC01D0